MNCIGLLLLLTALRAPAAPPADVPGTASTAAQVAALKKVDIWVGSWKGSGWSSQGGTRAEFDIVETVTRKAGGTVLMAEGQSVRRSDHAITHDGLALFYFDDRAGRYHWREHDAPWGALDADAKLIDGGLEWSFAAPGGATIRFTLTFDAQRWHESGEMSSDGKTWNKFMEMTLERQ